MGLRLLLLSWWTPKYIIRKELENISRQTTTALKALIIKHGTKEVDVSEKEQQSPTSIQEQRTALAMTQAKLVEILEATFGHEEAIRLGREALFSVGQDVGKRTREKLGVCDNPKDLIRAAKFLYRILGIEFHLEWLDNSSAKAIIDRCALSEHYSELTCEILSATDEGVIKGLQPNVTMKFKEYMTSGCKNCVAEIRLGEEEAAE